MSEASIESDKEVGVALALGAVAAVSAVVMLAYPGQLGKAWGFAGAFVFATLAVGAVQLFG
ncbi:hypothetical protein [Halorubrum sp. SD612]|uniref:DUF7525 family protein n=1 Tax=Halorubrum sp. SD612 TaxID=1855863 RepID=UPI000A2DB318|nr:hypothetical protein [Halorubrum sp. SD612]OTF10645.1 hypothetical protein B9G38_05135 [Halorubrum sp. SD612]